jgi:hypothetical protein
LKRIVLGFLLFCLLPLGVSAQADAWTIIYYSPADTDLEQFMIGDLMEMQIVGSTDEVNIVVEMDRAPGYDETNGTWVDTRRFLIGQGNPGALSSGDFQMDRAAYIASLEGIDPAEFGMSQDEFDEQMALLRDAPAEEFEAAMLGDVAPVVGGQPQGMQQVAVESIGEGESTAEQLSDFIIWSVKNYPAEHYMIVISDHGGGWHGIAFDETSGGDPITMQELEEALRTSTEATGVEKFDLVAFDACLMGQLEVYNLLAPYAQYTIAAEEPIPGAGWEYVTPLTALTQNPGMTAPEFGIAVIDAYNSYYTDVLQGYDKFDLHLIDLSQIGAVNEALDAFVGAIGEDATASIEDIGYARDKSFTAADGEPEYASVDLQDFMEQMIAFSDDPAIQEAAQGVIDAIEAVQIHGAASPITKVNGVAIYFPANLDDYTVRDNNTKYIEQVGGTMGSWLSFLNGFYGTAAEVYAPEKTGLDMTIVGVVPSDYSASVYDPPVVIFESDGTGIIDMQFYAAVEDEDGSYYIVDASPLELSEETEDGEAVAPYPEGPSVTEFQWNVEMPLGFDKNGNSEILTFDSDPDNPDQVTVEGIYHPRGGAEKDAYAIFDLETSEMVAIFGYEESEVGSAIGELSMNPGDSFEPYYQYLTEEGDIEYQSSGTQLFITDQPISFQYVPAPDGNYELTIWLEDIAGNVAYDTATFAIDNEDLDTNWSGYKDIDAGISFLYPWSWPDPTPIIFEDESYSTELTNEDGTQLIIVDTFDESFDVTSLDELIANGEAIIESVDGTAGEAELIEAGYEGEYEVAVIPYSYLNEEGEDRVAWLILAYSEDNVMGYQVDVDVPAADEEIGQELVSYITGSLYFDAPVDLDALGSETEDSE